MLTAELTRKSDLLPRESYIKVEKFVEQLIALNQHSDKEDAFKTFMEKNESGREIRTGKWLLFGRRIE